MRSILRAASALLILLAFGGCADGPSGGFDFPSGNYASPGDFFRGASRGQVTIRGTLLLPAQPQPGPLPVVIIAHTSAGVREDVQSVARRMTAAGYAALYYDSYAPRGISDIQQGGGQVALVNQAADALAALTRIAADPRLDAERVAVFGMSAGGGAAVLTAARFLQRRATGAELPRLAAHIAFYPGLHAAPAPDALGPARVLIVVGQADDYQSVARPRAWVAHVRQQQPSAHVRLLEVAGGPHSFLTPGLTARRVNDLANVSNCAFMLVGPGSLRWLATDGQVHATRPECRPATGGSVGYDAAAEERGMAAALAFLAEAFGQRR